MAAEDSPEEKRERFFDGLIEHGASWDAATRIMALFDTQPLAPQDNPSFLREPPQLDDPRHISSPQQLQVGRKVRIYHPAGWGDVLELITPAFVDKYGQAVVQTVNHSFDSVIWDVSLVDAGIVPYVVDGEQFFSPHRPMIDVTDHDGDFPEISRR